MTDNRTAALRRGLIASVHIAKTDMQLDEDTYRALLKAVTGHASAGKCTVPQLKAMLAEMRAKGWTPRPRAGQVPTALRPLHNKIAALCTSLECPLSYGEEPLRKFLCNLNMDYFLKKCLGNDYLEFDCEATIREIKSDIIRNRRYASIEHSVAREIWDSLRAVDANNASAMLVEMGEDAFDYMVGELYDHDRSLLPIMNRPNGQCVGFWERIWPCACEVWRKELAKEFPA